MSLHYLDFDYSEDEQGHGCFDAMASTAPQHVAAVRAEIARVLDWAYATFPDVRAPLDEGGEWDCELQGLIEPGTPLAISYDEGKGEVKLAPTPGGAARTTLTLTLSGSPVFCDAFRAEFEPGV
jgi:hypothetical protein